MLKFYKVRYEEEVFTPTKERIVHKRTEIVSARSSDAVFEDLLDRFGEHLLSMDTKEIDESVIKSNARIYIVL